MEDKDITVFGELDSVKSNKSFLAILIMFLILGFLFFIPEIEKFINKKEVEPVYEGFTNITGSLYLFNIHIQGIDIKNKTFKIYSEKEINLDKENIHIVFYDLNRKKLTDEKLTGNFSYTIKDYKLKELPEEAKYYYLEKVPVFEEVETTTKAPKLTSLVCDKEDNTITYTFTNNKLTSYDEVNKLANEDYLLLEESLKVFNENLTINEENGLTTYKIKHNYVNNIEYKYLFNNLNINKIKENITKEGYNCKWN